MKADRIEWRTYANSTFTLFVSRFACGLSGAEPPPTTSPSHAACHMGKRGAFRPLKLSRTNVRRWMAARADAPPGRPRSLVGVGSAGGLVCPIAPKHWARWPCFGARSPRCARSAHGPVHLSPCLLSSGGAGGGARQDGSRFAVRMDVGTAAAVCSACPAFQGATG